MDLPSDSVDSGAEGTVREQAPSWFPFPSMEEIEADDAVPSDLTLQVELVSVYKQLFSRLFSPLMAIFFSVRNATFFSVMLLSRFVTEILSCFHTVTTAFNRATTIAEHDDERRLIGIARFGYMLMIFAALAFMGWRVVLAFQPLSFNYTSV